MTEPEDLERQFGAGEPPDQDVPGDGSALGCALITLGLAIGLAAGALFFGGCP